MVTDVGVSTYEKNERRHLERSTASHNCISWGDNSSDVWSGFRVGRRANVKLLQDTNRPLWRSMMDTHKPMSGAALNLCTMTALPSTDTILPKKALQEPELANCIFIRA